MRPVLSSVTQLDRDAFVLDETLESTVGLEEHRGDSDLAKLDLGDEDAPRRLRSKRTDLPSPAFGTRRPGRAAANTTEREENGTREPPLLPCEAVQHVR